MSEYPIPEDLKQKCPLCDGIGHKESTSFRSPGTMRMGQCHACKGRGWIWALDQREMAERLATLEAEIERLQRPVSDTPRLTRTQVQTLFVAGAQKGGKE